MDLYLWVIAGYGVALFLVGYWFKRREMKRRAQERPRETIAA